MIVFARGYFEESFSLFESMYLDVLKTIRFYFHELLHECSSQIFDSHYPWDMGLQHGIILTILLYCLSTIQQLLDQILRSMNLKSFLVTIFGSNLGMFFHFMKNLIFFVILCTKIISITVMISEKKIFIYVSSCLKHFWIFVVHFRVYSSSSK